MEPLLFWMAINVVLGVALGAVPFFVARAKQAMKYGVSAWVLCGLAGLLVGVVGSLPIAIVLTVIAAVCSPQRLKSLGEKPPEGWKDAAILIVFLLLVIGVLVILAYRSDALG